MLNKIELLNKLKDKYNDNWPSEIEEGFQMAMDVIDDIPTVEAIPIEWLKEYENKIFKKPARKRFDWQVIDVINKLLKDWEKENETD